MPPVHPGRAAGRAVLLAALALLSQPAGSPPARAAEPPPPGVSEAPLEGAIKSIALDAALLSLEVPGGGAVAVRWSAATRFTGAAGPRELRPGDRVRVERGPGGTAHAIARLVVAVPAGVKALRAEEVEGLLRAGPGRAVVIDARPASQFAEGHLPGAVNVPWSDLEQRGPSLLPEDRSTPVVFYCGGATCDLSPSAAAVAQRAGYADVASYPAGAPGWQRSDRLLESTVEFARTGNAVIVDLRAPEVAAAGHLPGATGVPLSTLAARRRDFPAFKGAAIVLYGAGPAELARAAEQLRDWDYTAVTALGGGLEAWIAAGLPLERGPLPTTIHYQRRLGPDEVSPEDFRRAVADGSALLVDVRTPGEFARGHLPGAISLPLEAFAQQAAGLPRDRTILLYCTTGARAELALDAARPLGLRLKFLRAAVEFAPDGGWSVGG